MTTQSMQDIISSFPSFSVMQESVITVKPKVQSKCIIGLPSGKGMFAWILDNKCYLISTDRRTCMLSDIVAPFEIPNNSIFYGVQTPSRSSSHILFCVENVYYFNGKSCGAAPIIKKLHLFAYW